jgi:tetratricopeptide (TPR) repeat protein
MEAHDQPLNQDGQEKKIDQESNNKKKINKNNKFNWWQSLLILTLTLVISVGASYYVSKKYFWSNYDKNRFVQQLATAKAVADAKPNEPKPHVDLGYAYFLNKDYDNAIKQYKVAIDLDKNNFDAYFNLGLTYKEDNQLNDALKNAEKASEISPRDYKGFLLKGMVFRELKMYKDAMKSLNQANRLSQTNTDVLYEIGRVAEDQGDKKNAEEIYKDTLQYDPMYKPALEGLKRVAKK